VTLSFWSTISAYSARNAPVICMESILSESAQPSAGLATPSGPRARTSCTWDHWADQSIKFREAFVLGVAANITHGLKLTRKDRKAAAARILGMYPTWSDRTIAATAGLSHPTVAVIRRRCSTGKTFQLNTRLGHDGKARPLTSNSGRQAAAELILADHSTPLREVARQAHVSVGTAHDVQTRLKHGVDPSVPTTRGAGLDFSLARALAAVKKLRADPAVWSHQDGKAMLQLLSHSLQVAHQVRSTIKNAPQHCLDTIAEVAAALGDYWSRLARDLHLQAHTETSTTPLDEKTELT